MDIFLARQPIFDKNLKVYGYELLYRAGTENVYPEMDGDKASLAVIRNALLVVGSKEIAGGRRAFINFTRGLLMNGAALYLPKEIGVVEILEDIEPDRELLHVCRELRRQGYLLALDDFILRGNETNPFLDVVDIIKVDFRQTDEAERRAIASRFVGQGRVKLLAEKAETREELEQGLDMGYSYFQGYFFSKPVIISRRDIPGYKVNYLRVLKTLSQESLDFKALRKTIEHDPSLAYKLLKYINSAYFGLRHNVSSIKQALDMLGEREIKRWASLAVLTELGRDQPAEVLRISLLRARFCESVASLADMASLASELFLMGMFSCMDVLLGRPLEEVLEEIPLSSRIKDALGGGTSVLRPVFDLALSYEQADWDSVSDLASGLKLDVSRLPVIYAETVGWVVKMFK